MARANVNPATGLATDYLNLFNEYIMLAEMVTDGAMPPDTIEDWQVIDYETHFVQSGFSGVETVLASFRSLPPAIKAGFEGAVNLLIAQILEHKSFPSIPLCQIKHQRDVVASFIIGSIAPPDDECDAAQAEIDALFD